MMKRILLILMVALCAIGVGAQTSGKAVINFTSKSHDFGLVNEADGMVSHDFTFTNTGTSPLIIFSAIAQCGCTKPVYPKAPIKPGESGVITVKFSPDGFSGEFSKEVKVKSNAANDKVVKLRIRGVVIPEK